MSKKAAPVDAAIVGIVDTVTLNARGAGDDSRVDCAAPVSRWAGFADRGPGGRAAAHASHALHARPRRRWR
jgi:hypothetical protein